MEISPAVKANIALADEFDARRYEREEGLKEGLEEGRKKGLEEGRQREKIEIAKALLKVLSVAQTSRATGLCEKEVQSLADLEQIL